MLLLAFLLRVHRNYVTALHSLLKGVLPKSFLPSELVILGLRMNPFCKQLPRAGLFGNRFVSRLET